MNCPNCGHATPPTHAARCGHCNFKLPANQTSQASQSDTTLPCWNCRHPNPAEAERCEWCNAKQQTSPRSAVPFASRQPLQPQTRKSINIASHDK
ncbi:MAG: hypothetical protein KF734_12130 [Saprospiraceae bacterium]|nr:hypothetical protein [Saprospiraceae bacterium]